MIKKQHLKNLYEKDNQNLIRQQNQVMHQNN